MNFSELQIREKMSSNGVALYVGSVTEAVSADDEPVAPLLHIDTGENGFEASEGQTKGASSKRRRVAEVHNLEEKRRRSRINEKMKALQDLIPNSNKTDKASMLDEAIEYVKQLQGEVQNSLDIAQLYQHRLTEEQQKSTLTIQTFVKAIGAAFDKLGIPIEKFYAELKGDNANEKGSVPSKDMSKDPEGTENNAGDEEIDKSKPEVARDVNTDDKERDTDDGGGVGPACQDDMGEDADAENAAFTITKVSGGDVGSSETAPNTISIYA